MAGEEWLAIFNNHSLPLLQWRLALEEGRGVFDGNGVPLNGHLSLWRQTLTVVLVLLLASVWRRTGRWAAPGSVVGIVDAAALGVERRRAGSPASAGGRSLRGGLSGGLRVVGLLDLHGRIRRRYCCCWRSASASAGSIFLTGALAVTLTVPLGSARRWERRCRVCRSCRTPRRTTFISSTGGATSSTVTWGNGNLQVGPTAKRRARQRLVSRLIDVQLIRAGITTSLVGRHVGLAVVVGRLRGARVNDLDYDRIADATDRAATDGPLVGDLVAFATVCLRAAGALVARGGLLARTFRHVETGIAQTSGDVRRYVGGGGAIGTSGA